MIATQFEDWAQGEIRFARADGKRGRIYHGNGRRYVTACIGELDDPEYRVMDFCHAGPGADTRRNLIAEAQAWVENDGYPDRAEDKPC